MKIQHISKTLRTLRSLASASLMVLFGLWLLLGTGCASFIMHVMDKPKINVTSVKLLSAKSLTPKFEVGLHVVNTNAVNMNLRSMTYKIFLNGHEVVQGVAIDLPVVPAHGTAEFKVIANIELREGMHLLNDMLKNASTGIVYRVQAIVDAGAMTPMLTFEETGKFSP